MLLIKLLCILKTERGNFGLDYKKSIVLYDVLYLLSWVVKTKNAKSSA